VTKLAKTQNLFVNTRQKLMVL